MIKTILVIGNLFAGCGPLVAQSFVPEAAVDSDPALRLAFFKSIADDDATFSRMLDEGMTPDAELIGPPPDGFVRTFPDERLRYFLSSEQGFTALMLATVLGNEIFVRKLLAAGANPNKITKRHKTFALWLAGKYARIEIMRLLMGIGLYDPARGLFLSVIPRENAVFPPPLLQRFWFARRCTPGLPGLTRMDSSSPIGSQKAVSTRGARHVGWDRVTRKCLVFTKLGRFAGRSPLNRARRQSHERSPQRLPRFAVR